MKQSIFFPVMIVSMRLAPSFFTILAEAIMKFETPKGIQIEGVFDASDRLSDHIIEMVRKRNDNDDVYNPYIADEDISLMEIVIETEESLLCRKIPWFEDQVEELVRGYDSSVAIYLFYHINGGKDFQAINIAKVYTDNGIKITDSPIEDDITPLTDLSEYLFCLWNEYPEKSVTELYPDISAKLILLLS